MTTMKQWTETTPDADFAGLKFEETPVPGVGDSEVLVRFHASSLNYRDLAIAKGTFPFAHRYPIVPNSDGAGEVVQVGDKVTEFHKGDKVITLFNQAHQSGDIDPHAASSGVGGVIDGALREFGVYPETGLVKAPHNLDYVAASTLPCAALTSWNALYGLKPIKAGQVVLVQGTGGVSIFGLQFAKAAGAKVIATTSSTEKEKLLKDLGADHTVNYRTSPGWGSAVRDLTPGKEGVDHIIDVGGQGTLEQSLKCIKMDGVINIIGFLGASDRPQPTLLDALSHICTVRGVYVGSRALLKDMVRAIESTGLKPVVDQKVFELANAKEAFQYMASQKHVGKVVIRL
ncbi:zinc-type alcohol dehydrogenase-like protein [Penicillium argentinense]|uniref:Zinc-type alcohol dehydrogenase-like protein n=1 Tax=Penicillium argentinense TaxID=1131581 RepID=A0A9W9FHA2_9EURO|nr:zinc-type alcohol dehydrogenase-like protein [Penicillium argentinense]KAJ5100129.1 zinc-type alcohol dehydrogenase-like protein [Penicillium argentinense]